MASGHVNRAKRPNTWLHRPISNPVAFRGEADMNWQARRLNRSRMTRTGSRGPESDNSLRPLDLGSTPQPFAVMC